MEVLWAVHWFFVHRREETTKRKPKVRGFLVIPTVSHPEYFLDIQPSLYSKEL